MSTSPVGGPSHHGWLALASLALLSMIVALVAGAALRSPDDAATSTDVRVSPAASRPERLRRIHTGADSPPVAPPDEAPPVPAGAAAPQPERLRFLVVSEAGDPVAGAQLSVVDATDAPTAYVTTDPEGRCDVVASYVVTEIVVRCPGFATVVSTADALATTDGAHVVRLEADGVIRGVVRRPSGAAPRDRLLVSAWPADVPSARLAGRTGHERPADSDDPRLLKSWTDASGAFEIRGARRDTQVRLVAAGDGMVQTESWLLARVGAPDAVTIQVVPLFVLDVAFVDAATGEPVRALDTHGAGAFVRAPPHEGTSGDFSPWSAGLAWAGVRSPESAESTARLFRVYGIDIDAEESRPVPVTVHVPGYATSRVDIPAHRARSGAPHPAYELRLDRVATGFGSIEVSLGDTSEAVRRALTPAHTYAMFGELTAESPDADMLVGFPGIGRRPVTVTNVPEGRYRMRINIPLGIASACTKVHEFLVERDRTVRVVCDLTDAAAIDVRPHCEDGTEYTGPLAITVRCRGSTRGGMWAFQSPPYVLGGIDAGPYDLTAMSFAFKTHSDWVPVDTAASEATPVDVALVDWK